MQLDEIRQFYAEEIRAVANLQSKALVNAFAKVPRELFLGAGPWQIASPDVVTGITSYRSTDDDDPRHVYHNILIGIDPTRNLNNGHPSSIAFWLENLELNEGDRVLHVGCGVGYYTAIIAETVGSSGSVTAVELDADLASRARSNLAYLSKVEVLHGDGAAYKPGATDAILINAGATHPQSVWLDSLRDGGRLLCPLTFSKEPEGTGTGFMLKVKREGSRYAARSVSLVSIYPCIGARDEQLNEKLRAMLMTGGLAGIKVLRREPHESTETCRFHGNDFCLSA